MQVLIGLVAVAQIMYCSVATVRQYDVQPRYSIQYHDIHVVHQIPTDDMNQPVFNRLNVLGRVRQTKGFDGVIPERLSQGYQVIVAAPTNSYWLIQPLFIGTHSMISYPIHTRLQQRDRHILSYIFESLDAFVERERLWRPLCLVIVYPTEGMRSLRSDGSHDSFEKQRDFSIVQLFHFVHQRRYLNQVRIWIYPSLMSNTGYLIQS